MEFLHVFLLIELHNEVSFIQCREINSSCPILQYFQCQVLVKIAAAGVNPVDTYIRSGTYSRVPALPYTPGSDAAGTVQSVGDGVTDLKVI